MKWEKRYPQLGDLRTTKKFLWWPIIISDRTVSTTYWLETVFLTEEYVNVPTLFSKFQWIVVSLERSK